jgi:hypothetical protein
MKRRIVEASLWAPPLGVVAWIIVEAFIFPRPPGAGSLYEFWFGQYSGNFLLFMIFGTPIAYVAELFVGVPMYWWLVRTGRLRAGWVISSATLTGALVMGIPVIASDGFGDIAGLAKFTLMGTTAGLVAGVTFWLMAFADFRRRRPGL